MNWIRKAAIFFFVFCFPLLAFAQKRDTLKTSVYDLGSGTFELKTFDQAKHAEENSPIYFDSESPKSNAGRIVLTLSTLNREEVLLSWQNHSTKAARARWSVRLQYRLSESEAWKDVTDNRSRPYEFYTGKRAISRNFSNVLLPEECNNKPFVQIAWKISRVSGKGTPPRIQTRNISVSSLADPYSGLAAEVNLSVHRGKKFAKVEHLEFNHIPLPYTYPETIRLRVDGKNLRDSVSFEITGADKEYFSLGTRSLDVRKAQKSLTISYAPKKEGVHKAVLTVKTRKLGKEIRIPLEGSCAKASDFAKNLVSETSTSEKEIHFSFDLFSNKDYQFRMSLLKEENEMQKEQNEALSADVSIIYKWYRNSECLLTIKDKMKGADYCAPLQSPMRANRIEITVLNNDQAELSQFYFGFPKPKRAVRSGQWNEPDIWEPKGEPAMEDFVSIEDSCKIRVTSDVVCSMLRLGKNANVDIDAGKMFYVSGDILYGAQSYFTVHHNLLAEKWNYISSPVNRTKALIFSMPKSDNETWLMKYNTGVESKHGDNWSEYLVDPNFVLEPGQGYAVYTHDSLDVKFEGLLCNSKTTVTLSKKNKDSWNLVGNPFTAPLSTKKLFEDIDARVQGNAIFLFDRENMVYNPIIVDADEEVMIPSLESFFVEAIRDGEEITFKRDQQYVPKSGTGTNLNHNYLCLAAVKDGKRQYALMGMIDDALYGFDEYDAHKMFGISEQMPEIYFLADGHELSVNSFPDYPAAFDIGLYIGKPGRVELQLNNLSVLPENISVIMEDKYEHKFYDLCSPVKVLTDLKGGTANDRYRIYLNKAINIYEIHPEYSGIYLWSDNNRIFVYGDGTHDLQAVRVSDMDFKTVGEQTFDSDVLVFDQGITKGRYAVDIQVGDVWLKDFIVEVR